MPLGRCERDDHGDAERDFSRADRFVLLYVVSFADVYYTVSTTR